MKLYAAAGEAGGAVVGPVKRSGGGFGEPDPGRSAFEAARRARGQIRRYCAANGLNRLGTLTYRGSGNHDPVLLREHLGAFFRALRSELGGEPLPYLWVPEWHKTDHGLHAHFAVGRFVPRRVIERCWPHGFVHIKLLGDLPVGTGPLGEARVAARYLSKYAGKAVDDDRRIEGLHRYEVAQGFQPEAVRLEALTLEAVLEAVSAVMGGPPGYLWQSQVSEGWAGPPAVWASWD